MDRRNVIRARSHRRIVIGTLAAVLLTSILSAPASADSVFTGAGTIRRTFFGASGTIRGPIAGELRNEPIAAVLECQLTLTSGTLPSLEEPTAAFDGTAECRRIGRGVGAPGPWEVDFEGTLTGTVVQVAGSFGEPGNPGDPFECVGHIAPTSVTFTEGELQLACVVGPGPGSIVVENPLGESPG